MSGNSYLSKSSFIRGLQCHKALYLYKRKPELRDELTESQEAIFQTGTDVGILAQDLFPGGFEVPFEGMSLKKQIDLTNSKISDGETIIYEATVSHDNVLVKVDILVKGEAGWEIYEVKSSTSVKEVNINDVAVQYHVLKGYGLDVSKVCLVYINNQYVRDGDIELNKLFTIQDLTDKAIGKQTFIKSELKKQQAMLSCDMPEKDIGKHCSDPYDCDFAGYCWKHIPEQSVFNLRGKGIDKFDLYRRGLLLFNEIPKEELNHAQLFQLESSLQKKNYIDKNNLQSFLDTLWYPLYFLDFETFQAAVPLFDGTRPYQQVPFQYSLHRLDKEGGKLKHSEYLAKPGISPQQEIAERLTKEIPTDACVLAYSMGFEKGVLTSLQKRFPQHSNDLQALIENMRDLIKPFRSRDVYFWELEGSYSLKDVLPALVPELSYEGLEINQGGMAMEAYHKMAEIEDSAELEKLRQNLIEYCNLDTLAMVKILEKVKELI